MRIKTVISFLVGITIFAAVVWFVEPAKLLRELGRASPTMLGGFVVLHVVFFLLRALRWKMMLTPLKNNVSIRTAFWVTMIGYAVNIVIPLRVIGELSRAYLLDRKERLGFFQGLSSIGAERVLDLLAIAVLGLVGASLLPEGVGPPSWFLDVLRIVAAFASTAFVVILVAARREKLILTVVEKLLHAVPVIPMRWKSRLLEFVRSVISGVRIVRESPGRVVAVVLLSLIIWITSFASYYAVFIAFGYHSPWPVVLLGMMLVQVSFILPATPGQVGTFEAFWVLIYGTLGFTPPETVVAMAVASHTLGHLVILAAGLIGSYSLGVTFRSLVRIREPKETGGEQTSNRS